MTHHVEWKRLFKSIFKCSVIYIQMNLHIFLDLRGEMHEKIHNDTNY